MRYSNHHIAEFSVRVISLSISLIVGVLANLQRLVPPKSIISSSKVYIGQVERPLRILKIRHKAIDIHETVRRKLLVC